MLKRLNLWLVGLSVALLPAIALAQDLPAPDDLGGLIPALIEAAKGGEWSLVVSFALMILVFLFTKIKFVSDLLPRKALPWVSSIAGILLAVATTVATTGDWVTAVIGGLTTGLAASGFWSLVGKSAAAKVENKAV